MDIELAETLKLIIDRYEGRTQGSVFIPMRDFPWYNERNGQLTRLQEAGMITIPRYSDNGAEITLTRKGRSFFSERNWILFPQKGESINCPVCGYEAEVLNTDAARSWAEIGCENCLTYALRPDALAGIPSFELPLLSGYYRHARHTPLTMQCDDKESVRGHIEMTRNIVTRDYQLRSLLAYYYQKMTRFDESFPVEEFPAIAYATDEDDLMSLIAEAEEKGYMKTADDMITVTEEGKNYMDSRSADKKPTVFISYNWGSTSIADELENKLVPYAEVKRDKTTVKPWGDLQNFMRSIRDQDFAVLIISDAYLKSEACLFEVMELMKEQQWDERVMYVVTDDAHGVYDTKTHLTYIGYWEEKEQQLMEEIRKHNPAAVTSQAEELKKVQQIAINIGTFMAKVKRTKNPEMDKAIGAVIERVGGKILCSPETVEIQATNVNEIEDKIEGIVIPESLREGWNFHNDIALRLEMKSRHVFGDKDRPYTKIYDADSIENGKFAEVMIDVLREKTRREIGREDIESFIVLCTRFIGKSGYQIDKRIAQGLFDRFLELNEDL